MDILKLIQGMNDGGFAKDAGERLSEIIEAVEESGGKGALTLRLIIEPNEDGTAIVSAETAVKKPYPQRAPEIFFVDKGALIKPIRDSWILEHSAGALHRSSHLKRRPKQ